VAWVHGLSKHRPGFVAARCIIRCASSRGSRWPFDWCNRRPEGRGNRCGSRCSSCL